jgi:hypothetical protein
LRETLKKQTATKRLTMDMWMALKVKARTATRKMRIAKAKREMKMTVMIHHPKFSFPPCHTQAPLQHPQHQQPQYL